MRTILALIACVALAGVAAAQTTDPAFFEWFQQGPSQTQIPLFRKAHCINGQCFPSKQVGSFFTDGKIYCPLLPNGVFGSPTKPPIDPPGTPASGDKSNAGELHFGVDEGKRSRRDKVTYKGSEITMADAHRLAVGFADATLPDDGKKPHLTIAARDAAAYQRLTGLMGSSEAQALSDRYRVQLYDMSRDVDRAMMAPFRLESDPRFAKDGVVCYLQEPAAGDGPAKVLCAVGNVENATQLIEAVRPVDPASWDPSKAGTPASIPALWDWAKTSGGNILLWVLAAVGIFFAVKAFGITGKLSGGWEWFKRQLQPTPPPVAVVMQQRTTKRVKRTKPAPRSVTPAATS